MSPGPLRAWHVSSGQMNEPMPTEEFCSLVPWWTGCFGKLNSLEEFLEGKVTQLIQARMDCDLASAPPCSRLVPGWSPAPPSSCSAGPPLLAPASASTAAPQALSLRLWIRALSSRSAFHSLQGYACGTSSFPMTF